MTSKMRTIFNKICIRTLSILYLGKKKGTLRKEEIMRLKLTCIFYYYSTKSVIVISNVRIIISTFLKIFDNF